MSRELAISLWAICDLGLGIIYALAGKVYSVEGTDAEKLAVLKSLSATDYVTAKRHHVPSRMKIIRPDGTSKKGVATLRAIQDPDAMLFEELLRSLEQDLPPLPDFSGVETRAVRQVIGNSPLTVTTILCEDEHGAIRPIITSEDREWLSRHLNELRNE